jgi:uncharacterized membrane protein
VPDMLLQLGSPLQLGGSYRAHRVKKKKIVGRQVGLTCSGRKYEAIAGAAKVQPVCNVLLLLGQRIWSRLDKCRTA